MTTALYVPGTSETDTSKIIMSAQLVAGQTASNTDAITTATANITTNTTNITALQNSQASASTFGLAKVDGSTITAASGVLSTVNPLPAPIHASLGADVALNNAANYFDGPSIAQGTSGTWWVSGSVTLIDTAGVATFHCKLWDGTTVIASVVVANATSTIPTSAALSGYLASPAANLRISVKDISATTGKILFNQTGSSKDSTISAHRIA